MSELASVLLTSVCPICSLMLCVCVCACVCVCVCVLLQASQIGKLQQRIDHICQLLDETCADNTYQPARCPDLVYLVLKDAGEGEKGAGAGEEAEGGAVAGDEVKKALVLDNGRLQLDAVKQAFGLTTVELFVGESAGQPAQDETC